MLPNTPPQSMASDYFYAQQPPPRQPPMQAAPLPTAQPQQPQPFPYGRNPFARFAMGGFHPGAPSLGRPIPGVTMPYMPSPPQGAVPMPGRPPGAIQAPFQFQGGGIPTQWWLGGWRNQGGYFVPPGSLPIKPGQGNLRTQFATVGNYDQFGRWHNF